MLTTLTSTWVCVSKNDSNYHCHSRSLDIWRDSKDARHYIITKSCNRLLNFGDAADCLSIKNQKNSPEKIRSSHSCLENHVHGLSPKNSNNCIWIYLILQISRWDAIFSFLKILHFLYGIKVFAVIRNPFLQKEPNSWKYGNSNIKAS